jgi:hypothetical protein
MNHLRLLFWPIMQAFVIQGVAILFFATVMDGGITLQASLIASAPFWLCVPFLAWRDSTPSLFARMFVRWGLIVFIVAGTPALRPLILQM